MFENPHTAEFWSHFFWIILRPVFFVNKWIWLIYGEAVHEFWALFWLGLEAYDAIEFLYYHFAYDKSEPYTICTRFVLKIIARTKKSEQSWLIFLFYADSWISDINTNKAIILIHSFHLNAAISLCKLDGIGQQVEQHLRKPLFVSDHKQTIFEPVGSYLELDIFKLDLILKHGINFSYT